MPRFIDETGKRYGRWTVLRREKNGRHHVTRWRCQCSCGTERIVSGRNLRKGNSGSCGCGRVPPGFIDETGSRHGCLVVTSRAESNNGAVWRCLCNCGAEVLISGGNLRKRPRSCGVCRPLKKPREDLTARVFERLTVLRSGGQNQKGAFVWVCWCRCGKEIIIEGSALLRGRTKSCGCLQRERAGSINRLSEEEKLRRLAESRPCKKCGEITAPEGFYVPKGRPPLNTCKKCARKNGRKNWLSAKYRLTTKEFDQLLHSQGNKCKICACPFEYLSEIWAGDGRGRSRIQVDHCHTSGRVRGLLCPDCNKMLGNAKDRPEILEAGGAYLKEIPFELAA